MLNTANLSTMKKKASLKAAFIWLALFALNALILGRLDQPLEALANGEPKLDLRFGYDLSTVERLFRAYGEQGRTIYQWNLLVDTPFPILGAVAVMLFVALAFQRQPWKLLLMLPPLIFAATDLFENLLLFLMVQAYPDLSPGTIVFASAITQIKRSMYYISAAELILSVLILMIGYTRKKTAPAW